MFNRYEIRQAKAPCRDCPDRSPTCHSECVKYMFFEVRNEQEREEIRKKAIRRAAPIIRNIVITDKMQKRHKKHKGY